MFSIRLTDRLIRSQQRRFFYPFLANSEASPYNNEEHEMRGNTVRAFDFNILPLRQYSDGVYDGVDFIASAYSDADGEEDAGAKG